MDMGLLAQTAEPAKEVLGVEQIAVVADRGYFKIEDIEACEKAGIEPYVPRPQRGPSVRAGPPGDSRVLNDAPACAFNGARIAILRSFAEGVAHRRCSITLWGDGATCSTLATTYCSTTCSART